MKKIKLIILAFVLSNFAYSQTTIVDPIDSVKAKRYGQGAIVTYWQMTTDSVFTKIEQNQIANFPAGPVGSPIKYIGNTIAMHSDTLPNVIDTSVTWIRVRSYLDLPGLDSLSTTNPVVMIIPPYFVSHTLIGIPGGFKSTVQFNPGNTNAVVKGTYGLDRVFQAYADFHPNDPVFSIGLVLSKDDSIITAIANDTIYWKYVLTQDDGTTITLIDSVLTLPYALFPYGFWFANPTSPDTATISWTIGTDGSGLAGEIEVLVKKQSTGVVVDTIRSNTAAVAGNLYTSGSAHFLETDTWYDFPATFTTSLGTYPLALKSCKTKSAPVPFSVSINSVAVGQYVSIDFDYSIPVGDSATFISGYGDYMTNILNYVTTDSNVVNNGNQTNLFLLPNAVNWYTAHVQGIQYHQGAFVGYTEDTAHFFVGSLTGFNDLTPLNEGADVDFYQVWDTKGSLVYEGSNLTYFLLPKNTGLIVSAFNKNKKVYTKKVCLIQ